MIAQVVMCTVPYGMAPNDVLPSRPPHEMTNTETTGREFISVELYVKAAKDYWMLTHLEDESGTSLMQYIRANADNTSGLFVSSHHVFPVLKMILRPIQQLSLRFGYGGPVPVGTRSGYGRTRYVMAHTPMLETSGSPGHLESWEFRASAITIWPAVHASIYSLQVEWYGHICFSITWTVLLKDRLGDDQTGNSRDLSRVLEHFDLSTDQGESDVIS
ncbi:hypothetical protein PENSPDRAFT_672653 [Peniophora sp. CONT]|nr:hypothetical protein PENSPDRAFT_672653 [Peniophora sp. CONT]